MSHPRHDLDEVIHSPVRMSVVAVLSAAGEVEFAFVRDAVEVTDPTLSKHVTTLEKAGYVEVVKGYLGKRPRTWLKLTPEGRAAFARHLAALKAIADGTGMP